MTLTETAILTKKVLLFLTIFLIISLIAWLSWRYYYINIYLPSLPIVETLPDIKYGILPKPNLVVNNLSGSNYKYVLNTTTGELPLNIPKIMKVFFAPQLGTTFLALDRAKDLAKLFNFMTEPELAAANQYRFIDETGEMIIDLNSGNFKYRRTAQTQEDVILKDAANLTSDFKNFLSEKKLLNEELTYGRTKVSGSTITLWQDSIEDYPMVTAKFSEGLIKATVTNFDGDLKKYPTLEYIYWPVDISNFSTYPVKTAKEAFENLKEGSGSIIFEPKGEEVSLTNIYLAYLLTDQYTPYVQPVFVFEGENFTALIPAIKEELLSK